MTRSLTRPCRSLKAGSGGLTGSRFRRWLHGLPIAGRLMELAAGHKLKGALGGKVRFFGIGGARLDPDVELFLKRAKFPYAIGYGLTETSPLLAGSGPRNTVPGTVGPVLDGVELRRKDFLASQDPFPP